MPNMHYKPHMLLWVLLLTLAGCTSDSIDTEPGGEASSGPVLTLSIGVQTGDSFLSTRATDVGDPGTYEVFREPRYLYVFLYDEEKKKSYVVCKGKNSEGEDAYVCYDLDSHDIEPIDLGEKPGWSHETLPGSYAPLPTPADSILRHGLPIDLSTITGGRGGTARIYVAAAYNELGTLSKGTATGEEESIDKEPVIKDIKFDVEKHGTYSATIRDIYSTPYNLATDGTLLTTGSNTYYGTLDGFYGQELRKEIILYHVGAKLDLNWNIPDEQVTDPTDDTKTVSLQQLMWLSDMELKNMKKASCYLFRPMENIERGGDTYDEGSLSGEGGPIISTGNQWYGRHVFYVIPYFDDTSNREYKFKMQLWRNGPTQEKYIEKYLSQYPASDRETAISNYSSKSGYMTDDITVDVPDQRNDLAKVFTPWMLGRLTIKTQFTHNRDYNADVPEGDKPNPN